MDFSDRFKSGLKDTYNMSYDDLINMEYKYAGGDSEQHHINYWKIMKKSRPALKTPPKRDQCVCGHYIQRNCYIVSKNNDAIIILGSCCIKRFITSSTRTCQLCGATHKCRKLNVCKKCTKYACNRCGSKKERVYDEICNTCFYSAYTAVECTRGFGECFTHVCTDRQYFRQTKECSCKLIPCPDCGEEFPYYYLSCHDGYCMSCNVINVACGDRVYLNVPYNEKEQAKTYGCRWEPRLRKWYICKNTTNLKNVVSTWGCAKISN